MKAVILAGGKGSNIRPYWATIPKTMLPVFDRPAIEHLVRRLSRCGITELLVAVSRETPELPRFLGDGSQYGVSIAYYVENEPLGTAGAVRAFSGMLDTTFLVIPGDCATDIDFAQIIESHLENRGIATIVASSVQDRAEYNAIELDSDHQIRRFVVKPPDTEKLQGDLVSTGIYVFEPEIFGSIPPFQSSDFALDIFPRLLTNGETVRGYQAQGYWSDLGLMLNYRDIHQDALTGRCKMNICASEVSPGVFMGESAHVELSAQITGPAYIGNGSYISSGANIQSRSIIGAESIISRNSTVYNSIIGMNSLVESNSRISGCILMSPDPVTENSQLFGINRLERARYISEVATVIKQTVHGKTTQEQSVESMVTVH